MKSLFFDEAGYTGNNLTDSDQGFLSDIPQKVAQMAEENKKTYSFSLPESELKIALCARG